MKKTVLNARQMGRIGGRTAAANLTPEQRRERALKASRAAALVRTAKAAAGKLDASQPVSPHTES